MMRSPLFFISVLAMSVCLLAGIGQAAAEATEHFADPQGALGVARGAAAAEVRAALTARTQDCTSAEFKPTRCALADNALNADIHYGATHRDRRWAFISVRWQSDPAGNAVEAKGLVFIAEGGSGFRLLGQIDLVGDSVSDVVFEPGRITYATNYLRPDDSRSNPTGRRRYEIPLGANGIGPVAIQRTGFGAAISVQSSPQPDEALPLVGSTRREKTMRLSSAGALRRAPRSPPVSRRSSVKRWRYRGAARSMTAILASVARRAPAVLPECTTTSKRAGIRSIGGRSWSPPRKRRRQM